MPTVNIYLSEENEVKAGRLADSLIRELRECVARELSCGERELQPSEISVRCLAVHGDGLIAPIEVDITAHAYEERVKRADSLCLMIRKFLMERISARDVRVWLNLTELGHSWED